MLVATPDMDVDLEHLYYYEVIVPEEVSAVLEIAYADNSLLSQDENGILYIDGIINESSSLIADFRYSNNLSAVGMILCDLLIILCAVLCYVGIYHRNIGRTWLVYVCNMDTKRSKEAIQTCS